MIRDNGVSYYCNLATPYVLDKEALKYIDYDLDVKVFPDGENGCLILTSTRCSVVAGSIRLKLTRF
jgi:Uncharacterized domain/protein associated with RNAses G and E